MTDQESQFAGTLSPQQKSILETVTPRETIRLEPGDEGPDGTDATVVLPERQSRTDMTSSDPMTSPSVVKQLPSFAFDGDEADFLLHDIIGTGGQGEVWGAEQICLHRQVAVKRLKRGSVTAFIQEAFTSAALDHPNIVPIYDLGRSIVNGRERPLLAMKYVQGRPWDDVIAEDRAKEDFSRDDFLTRHLRTLIDVCNALAYAHSKGIIHRDLKPQQVMIGDYGEVFLMDWGLAVYMLEDVPMVTKKKIPKFRHLTATRNRCGTPAYMAPEQTDADNNLLGFHTDIYLVGGILFELVSGYPPHPGSNSEQAFYAAMENKIRPIPEDCPAELREVIEKCLSTLPSRRPGSVGEIRDEIEEYLSGAGKKRESREITNQVREELDEMGPSPTYPQLTRLEERLERAISLWADNRTALELRERTVHLHTEVALREGDLALAQTLAGRVRDAEARDRFLVGIEEEQERLRRERRERRTLAVATSALSLLILLVIGAWYVQSVRAELERERQRTAMKEETAQAEARAAEQERQAKLFREVNQLRSQEADLAERLRRDFHLPNTLFAQQIQVGREIAPIELEKIKAEIGDLRERRAALEERTPLLEKEPTALALGEANITLLTAASTSDYERAYELYQQAESALSQSGVASFRQPPPDPQVGLGITAARLGDYEKAASHLRMAVKRARSNYGPDHPETAEILALAGEAFQNIEDTSEAYRTFYAESLAILEPLWLELSLSLTQQWDRLKEHETALKYAEASLPVTERLEKEKPGEIARLLNMIGTQMDALGQYEDSTEYLEKALEIRQEIFGGNHPETAESLNDLGEHAYQVGDFSTAEDYLRRALEIRRSAFGESSAKTSETYASLAAVLNRMERYDEADEFIRRALEIDRALLGAGHPDLAASYHSYAANLRQIGRFEEARRNYAEALNIKREAFGEFNPSTASTYNGLGNVLMKLGALQRAELSLLKGLIISREELGDEHPNTAKFLGDYGRLLNKMRMNHEACIVQLETREIFLEHFGPESEEANAPILDLIDCTYAMFKDGDRQFAHWMIPLAYHQIEYLKAQPVTTASVAREGWLETNIRAIEMIEAMGPGRIWFLRPLLFRSYALAKLLDLPANHPDVMFLEKRIDEFGFRAAAKAIEISEETWPDPEEPVSTEKLLGVLDSVAVMADWKKEFPDLQFDIDKMKPSREELARRSDQIVEERRRLVVPNFGR